MAGHDFLCSCKSCLKDARETSDKESGKLDLTPEEETEYYWFLMQQEEAAAREEEQFFRGERRK